MLTVACLGHLAAQAAFIVPGVGLLGAAGRAGLRRRLAARHLQPPTDSDS